MKILCLCNNPCALPLFDWLEKQGNEVVLRTEELIPDWCASQKFNFALSYTYRHILSARVLNALGNEVLNIHNSFLPFNRGADPNIWSAIDGTPRGVLIHFMDEKLDKGRIVAQAIVPFEDGDTLQSSYNKLDVAAQTLFKQIYPLRRFWHEMEKVPLGRGRYHSVQDGKKLKALVFDYALPVDDFRKLALSNGGGYNYIAFFTPTSSMPRQIWRRRRAA